MNKTNLGIIILLGISIVGVIVLTAIDKSAELLTPVITALLGFLAGINKEVIASFLKVSPTNKEIK